MHAALALRRDEVRNVWNTALNGAAVRRFTDRKMNRYVPFSNFKDSRDVTNKRIAGSSLAADLVLIGIFGVVDVVISCDDEFALLAVLS